MIETLRSHKNERVAVETAHGTFEGFIAQDALRDRSVFVLLGARPDTPPEETTVIALSDITGVRPAEL